MAYNTSDRKDTLLATMYFHYIQRSKSAQQISAASQCSNTILQLGNFGDASPHTL